jgi:hypothetical protein
MSLFYHWRKPANRQAQKDDLGVFKQSNISLERALLRGPINQNPIRQKLSAH